MSPFRNYGDDRSAREVKPRGILWTERGASSDVYKRRYTSGHGATHTQDAKGPVANEDKSSTLPLYFTVIALPWRSTVLPTANRTQPSLTQYSSTLFTIHPVEQHPHAPLQKLGIMEGAGQGWWKAGRAAPARGFGGLRWRHFSSVMEASFVEGSALSRPQYPQPSSPAFAIAVESCKAFGPQVRSHQTQNQGKKYGLRHLRCDRSITDPYAGQPVQRAVQGRGPWRASTPMRRGLPPTCCR